MYFLLQQDGVGINHIYRQQSYASRLLSLQEYI